MRGAVERLRPHNSTLFRLGCLRFTIRYTGDSSTSDLIKSFQCNVDSTKVDTECCPVLLHKTAFALHCSVSKFLSVYFQLKCIYDTLKQCIISVYMQCMPPLDLSPPEREPTMESGGIVPPSLPPSSLLTTLQCNARNPLLQRLKCRENGPAHQPVVPPIVHSRPLLPVTDLNHQIQAPAFLFLTPHLSTELYLSATLSLISKCPTKSDWNDLPNPNVCTLCVSNTDGGQAAKSQSTRNLRTQ